MATFDRPPSNVRRVFRPRSCRDRDGRPSRDADARGGAARFQHHHHRPQSGPGRRLIWFSASTERAAATAPWTLRLTRESVVKAVAYGMKPAEIVDRLRRLATNEVPSNVLRQVSDWCGWVRRANASTAMIVRCQDSETADRIVAVMKRQQDTDRDDRRHRSAQADDRRSQQAAGPGSPHRRQGNLSEPFSNVGCEKLEP